MYFSIIRRMLILKLMLFSCALLLSLIVAQYFYYLAPRAEENQQLNNQLDGVRKKISYFTQLEAFNKRYDELRKELADYNARLNNIATHAMLTETLHDRAHKHHVKIISEINKKLKNQESVTPLSQRITIEGDYFALRKYLYDLNRLDSLSFIRQIRMEKKENSQELKTMLELITYKSP